VGYASRPGGSMRNGGWLVVGMAVVGGWSLACGSLKDAAEDKAKREVEEQVLEHATGTDVEIGADGQVTSIAGSADGGGQYQLGTSVAIPADYPSADAPLPPGVTWTGVYATPGAVAGKNDFTLGGTSPQSAADVAEFYRKSYSGWNKTMEMASEGSFILTFTSPDGKRTMSLTASPGTGGDPTAVMCILANNAT
jgi:hypothetical protein